VALLHYTAPPVIGGVERVLADQARVLADAGHPVRMVVGRGARSDRRVGLVRLPMLDTSHPRIARMRRELAGGSIPTDFERTADEIEHGLRDALAGVDVVFAHNVASLNFNLPLTAALHRLAGAGPAAGERPRLLLWHHDLAWTSPLHRPSLHERYPWDLLRSPWPGAAQVAVSEQRRDELAGLMGLGPDDVFVVPNGVDVLRTLRPSRRTAEILGRDGILQSDPLLLLPARITPRKNIGLAVHVVAAMHASGRSAGLLVSGPADPHRHSEDPYLDSLLALRASLGLEGSVRFLSHEIGRDLPDAVVRDLYPLADALILPSTDEGFGLPIIEAAVNRLPILCTDLEVLRSLAGADALYFATTDDPAAIAAAALRWLDADRLQAFSRRIRRTFDWSAIYREKLAPLIAGA
jgi:glycosyltransferase involved in cell wall biosynthesis